MTKQLFMWGFNMKKVSTKLLNKLEEKDMFYNPRTLLLNNMLHLIDENAYTHGIEDTKKYISQYFEHKFKKEKKGA